jgi:hypothetical protein
LDYAEFSCRWIDKKEIWKVADDVREKYWPESTLPGWDIDRLFVY